MADDDPSRVIHTLQHFRKHFIFFRRATLRKPQAFNQIVERFTACFSFCLFGKELRPEKV